MNTVIPSLVASDKPLNLVGCGILRKEVQYLIQKNAWNVETQFLDSSLHNYFGKLYDQLNAALNTNQQQGKESIVFYGCCHPKIDTLLEQHQTLRTEGQNCIVMVLGYELFMQQLEKGAYFLLEDWALTWKPMLTRAFGSNIAVMREIFHSSHQYILAIRTPCSGDFEAAAQEAAAFVDLPLVWMDADLTHLEAVLGDAIARKQSVTV